MSFEVPDEVDWREVDYLKGLCLVSLFSLNKEIFSAVVILRYLSFREDPAFSKPNSFFIFCVTLSLEMRDAYSQRGHRRGEPPKALTRAVWKHLEIRGFVKGPPQVAFRDAKPIYDAFARFLAVQVLGGAIVGLEVMSDSAGSIKADVEQGIRGVKEVATIRNPWNPDSSDC